VKIMVIPANEELFVAREVKRFSEGGREPAQIANYPSRSTNALSTINHQPST
jgi:hypothetical protein